MRQLKLIVVTEANSRGLRAKAEFAGCVNTMGQFKLYSSGGEDGLAKCAALVESKTEKVVGFVAYIISDENLDTYVNAYINVEYVFLHARLRQKGNSHLFISHIVKVVSLWIPLLKEKFKGGNIQLYSISSAISDEGTRFIAALDRGLHKIAAEHMLAFKSSSDE